MISREQRRLERREAKKLREGKKLKRVKRKGGREKASTLSDPYVQLAFFAFGLFALVGYTIFRMMHRGEGTASVDSRDPFKAFEKKLQAKSGLSESKVKPGFLNKLRGGMKYVIPESMAKVGCKQDWYTELRREYDTDILPKDDERTLKWVDEERKRHGIYKQAPKAQTSYDINNCPEYPPEGYPMQWPVLEVLDNWSPDDPTPHHEIYQGWCIFDYRTEMEKANNYREAELPFIVRNDPAVARAAERWSRPEFMERLLMGDEDQMRRTEYSPNNHFMYWVDKRPRDQRRAAQKEIQRRKRAGEKVHNGFGRGDQVAMAEAMRHQDKINELKDLLEDAKEYLEDHSGDEDAEEEIRQIKKELNEEKQVDPNEHWQPPTENLRMTYLEWLEHANVTDDKLGPENPHWYFRLIGCGNMGSGTADGSCDKGSSEWLFDELTHFQPREGDERPFYLINPQKQQGIHCRFGMKGVIAENHFDLSRNAITLLYGQRRYILAHPNQCNNMNLLPRGHPSARHSAVDWSDPDLEDFPTFADAHVNEVVMQPGDVMYLPTNWFHYIISLELNFQCNTRSGGEKLYRKEINDCGF